MTAIDELDAVRRAQGYAWYGSGEIDVPGVTVEEMPIRECSVCKGTGRIGHRRVFVDGTVRDLRSDSLKQAFKREKHEQVLNMLIRAGYWTVEQVAAAPDEDLLSIYMFGPASLVAARDLLGRSFT